MNSSQVISLRIILLYENKKFLKVAFHFENQLSDIVVENTLEHICCKCRALYNIA